MSKFNIQKFKQKIYLNCPKYKVHIFNMSVISMLGLDKNNLKLLE